MNPPRFKEPISPINDPYDKPLSPGIMNPTSYQIQKNSQSEHIPFVKGTTLIVKLP